MYILKEIKKFIYSLIYSVLSGKALKYKATDNKKQIILHLGVQITSALIDNFQ